jgi:hypothetical protein
MLGTPETHRPQQTRQQKSKKLIQNDVTAVFLLIASLAFMNPEFTFW